MSNAEEGDCSGDDASNNSKETKNVEKHNTENIDRIVQLLPRGARKLSPIIYNRSRSPTPELSTTKFQTILAEKSEFFIFSSFIIEGIRFTVPYSSMGTAVF